jgi:hypothetical protein
MLYTARRKTEEEKGQALTDILASLDPSESDESLAGLVQSLRDGERGFGFTFSSDDGGLTFLLGLRWLQGWMVLKRVYFVSMDVQGKGKGISSRDEPFQRQTWLVRRPAGQSVSARRR